MTEQLPSVAGDAPVSSTAKVAFLLRRAFPEPPEVIETHWSWVFLTADRAYKMKKPVRTPFWDQRDVHARRADCESEVALNRDLAPGVYLGVVPVTWDLPGRLALDGAGQPVEWLVVMRRLPTRAMLDHRLRHGHVERGELEALARHLVAFYRSTETAACSPDDHRRHLRSTLDDDRAELLRRDGLLDDGRIRRLTDALATSVQTDVELGQRAERVVDGHGDLRPEHIAVAPEPLVIDRITFAPRLRRRDPVDDLALLAVECELLGAPEAGTTVLDLYQDGAGDVVGGGTIALYSALRATSRARLSIAHLHDGDHGLRQWLDRTDAYVEIAERHLDAHLGGG